MNTHKAALIAAAVGLVSVPAFAAELGDTSQARQADVPTFEELDKNEDGVILPEEARGTWLEKAFNEVDTNQDGYVTRAEYQEASS